VRCTLQAQHQPIASTDSLKQIAQKNIGNDSLYCDACLMVARKYDELKMFDSMQNWMNKAFFRLPTDKQTLQRFHFHAYQSIAFYYNDLLQLDLYESKKVMKLASLMQDSILLTTGNNFMGLALSNIREYQKAIPYFYEGMKYARQPPYPPPNISWLPNPIICMEIWPKFISKRGRQIARFEMPDTPFN
jgi:hypothetical protein